MTLFSPASFVAVPGSLSSLALIPPFFLAQGMLAAALLALLALKHRLNDAYIEAALDRFLQKESEALRRRTRTNPLDFRTSEHVRPDPSTIGWGLYPGKVEIVRTIRAAIDNGYRIRLRAYTRGVHGRIIVRSREVDLRRGG
jgi:hypothetical protein